MIRSPAESEAGVRAAGGDATAYLTSALPQAQAHARAPISGFAVGAVGRGASGATYFGFNVEFPGRPLHETLHAEEHAVRLAEAQGDRVLRLAVTAPPCGHCRALLWRHAPEMQLVPGDRPLRTLWPWPPAGDFDPSAAVDLAFRPLAAALVRALASTPPRRLALDARVGGWDRQVAYEWAPGATIITPDGEGVPERFLPAPFGPAALGIVGSPFENAGFAGRGEAALGASGLARAALAAAERAWSPVTASPSGLALRAGAQVVTGSFLESVAFNPSISALAAARLALADRALALEDASEAVLVERADAAVSYADWTREALARVASGCALRVIHAQFDGLEPPRSGKLEP